MRPGLSSRQTHTQKRADKQREGCAKCRQLTMPKLCWQSAPTWDSTDGLRRLAEHVDGLEDLLLGPQEAVITFGTTNEPTCRLKRHRATTDSIHHVCRQQRATSHVAPFSVQKRFSTGQRRRTYRVNARVLGVQVAYDANQSRHLRSLQQAGEEGEQHVNAGETGKMLQHSHAGVAARVRDGKRMVIPDHS